MLGVLVAVQYISAAASTLATLIPVQTVYFPRFTTILFLISSIILICFPLIELLYLATKKKQNSEFFYQNAINDGVLSKIGDNKLRFVVGIIFYFIIFISLPIILQFTTGFPIIISLLMIAQLFPTILLGKLGTSGYFWGINLHYYNIPEKRTLIDDVLHNYKKGLKKFEENPIPILAVPIMIFVYANSFISLGQMIAIIFESSSAQDSLSFTFLLSTSINVLLALVGYYNKYWKKQVKYKLSEILFAGYLICSLSFNLFLNFLVKQPNLLLNDLSVVFGSEINQNTYKFFVPIAMIQKIIFVVFVTYYFLSKGKFKRSVLESILLVSRNRLNPKPLLNLITNKDETIRSEAQNLLEEMYRMYSLKYVPPPEKKKKSKVIELLSSLLGVKKRKQAPFEPIFRVLGSYKKERRKTAKKMIPYMIKDDPERFIELFNKHVRSNNSRKVANLLEAATLDDFKKVYEINLETLLNVLLIGDKLVQKSGMEFLIKHHKDLNWQKNTREILGKLIFNTINSPSINVQETCFSLLSNLDMDDVSEFVSLDSIMNKTEHPNPRVQQNALMLVENLQTSTVGPEMVPKLLKMLDDPDEETKRAAVKSLCLVAGDVEMDLAVEKLQDLMSSKNENLQKESIRLATILITKNPEKYPETLLKKITKLEDFDHLGTFVDENQYLVVKYPNIFLPLLKRFMEQSSIELKEIAKKSLVKIGTDKFEQILDILLNVKEDSRFAVRNFTREILVELGKQSPDKLIQILQDVLIKQEQTKDFGGLIPNLTKTLKDKLYDENFRINAASVLGELSKLFPEEIRAEEIIDSIKYEKSWRVRREIARYFGQMTSNLTKFPFDQFKMLINDENGNVRRALIKSLRDLTEKSPSRVPFEILVNKINDEDTEVREEIIGVVGRLAENHPDKGMEVLIEGLRDEKWPVRNAAAEAIGNLAKSMPEAMPVEILKDIMLNDKDKWTKWQVTRTLQEIVKVRPEIITLKEIVGKVELVDENVSMAYVELLRNIKPEPIEKFFQAIKPLLDKENESIQELLTTTIYQVYNKTKSEYLLSEILKGIIDKDSSVETSHTCAIAARKIAKYDKGEVHKRVKKALGTKCKQTRDPVICKEFTDLE